MHIGVVAPPFYSHANALQALAGELVARGHRVTFFQQADAQAWLTDSTLGFHAVGLASHAPGSLPATLKRAASPGGPWGLRRVIRDMAGTTQMLCEALPGVLRQTGVQGLIGDQMEAAGGLVAAHLELPFVSVACALPVNRDPAIPLPVMPFGYDISEQGRQRVQASTRIYDLLMTPLRRAIARQASALGLTPRDGLHECLSPLAHISQTIETFDFPRPSAPACFHAVGPLRATRAVRSARPAVADWQTEARGDRPFIFASLGTLQGHRYGLFKRIARACRRINAQLLVAHCGGLNDAQCEALRHEGATWVTDFADQAAALARADVVVSHGGLNTVMDAIQARTPILVIPIAFDQPGVAMRVQHAGIGRRVWPPLATSARLAKVLRALLDDPSTAAALARQAVALSQAGGTSRAVDIIENVFGIGRAHATELA